MKETTIHQVVKVAESTVMTLVLSMVTEGTLTNEA